MTKNDIQIIVLETMRNIVTDQVEVHRIDYALELHYAVQRSEQEID